MNARLSVALLCVAGWTSACAATQITTGSDGGQTIDGATDAGIADANLDGRASDATLTDANAMDLSMLDGSHDMSAPVDMSSPVDAGSPVDMSAPVDLGSPIDMGRDLGTPIDMGTDFGAPVDMGTDLGPPPPGSVTVSPTSGLTTTEAGGTDTFTMVLAVAPTANVTISLTSSDTSEGTPSPSSVTFTTSNWSTPQTITVTGVDDAMVDDDIAYTIITGAASSSDSNYNGRAVADVSVTNIDNDVAPAMPPRLTSKNIFGAPSGSFTIGFSGVASTNLELRFRSRAYRVVHTSSVSPLGSITLPAVAGQYTTELRDVTNGNASYGHATITRALSTFTPVSSASPSPDFGPYSHWPTTSMETGDFNNDGYQDIVFLSGTDGTGAIVSPGVYLYRWNNGTQTLNYHGTISIGTTIGEGVRFADFDNDTDLDLVFATYDPALFTRKMCYALNNGSGTFATPVCRSDAGSSLARPNLFDIAVADLDRDGFVDVVSAGGTSNSSAWVSGRISVWYNSAGTAFDAPVNLDTGGAGTFATVAIGDFQDDGRLDVFAAGGVSGGLYIFPQGSDGSFSTSTASQYASTGANAVAVGYLNADTKLDAVVVSMGSGGASVMYSNSTDNTMATMVVPTPAEQFGGVPSIVDLSQSGSPDVVFAPKNRLLYVGRSGVIRKTSANLTSTITVDASTTITGSVPMSSWALSNALFTDFNNDGYIDLFYYSIDVTKFFEITRGG